MSRERAEDLARVARVLEDGKGHTALDVAKALATGLGHDATGAARMLGALVRMGKAKSLAPCAGLPRMWVRS